MYVPLPHRTVHVARIESISIFTARCSNAMYSLNLAYTPNDRCHHKYITIHTVLIQLQQKGEALQEKEREVMEVKSRLEGEVTDLHRDLNDKKKVNIYFCDPSVNIRKALFCKCDFRTSIMVLVLNTKHMQFRITFWFYD